MARWKNINGVLQKISGSVRIDQVLNKLSRNAISNKAVSEKFEIIQSHIGSVIMSTALDTEEKVIAIYGGTSWEKIEGRFLLGASSTYGVGTTGGSATHTLTVNEMPSHNHGGATGAMNQHQTHDHWVRYFNGYPVILDLHPGNDTINYLNSRGMGTYNGGTAMSTNPVNLDHVHSIGAQGGGQAFNIMPPYKAVYIWERTA
jgi:microcystin-dependent protein